MTARVIAVTLALGVAGAAAMADQAKPRGGSGSGGAGARHPSPSGGSAPRASSSSQSHGSRSSSSSPSNLTPAERRHPRAGTGRGGYPYSYYPGYYPGYGYGYSPWYYPSYYYGYWPYWGGGLYFGSGGSYGGYYGGYYGGGYGYPYVYHSSPHSDAGALRLLVDPEDTKVYLDGYYAGEVDDFDGMFQRLYASPGRHEVTLKRDGYRTHRVRVYVGEESTVKIRHDMEKGSGPDTMEDLAGERGLYEERRPESRRDEDGNDAYDDRPPARQGERDLPPAGVLQAPSPGGDHSSTPGLLVIDVSPNDASVYVDGRFIGNARQTGEIELAPGPHRVEIVRPGYGTAEREFTIEAGRTQRLEVSLRRP